MTIYVDADACPVKRKIVETARRHHLPVTMVTDVSHELEDGYSRVIIVDQGKDSADLRLANLLMAGDVVVTQDFGVAAMALAKKAKALNQNGLIFTEENMDGLLFERHVNGQRRRAGQRTKGPSKRTAQQDQQFIIALEKILEESNAANK